MTRRVTFAQEEVSVVYHVNRKTVAEARELFYQPEDVMRFRYESRMERLAADMQHRSSHSTNCNIEKLNAMTQALRRQFQGHSPVTTALPYLGPRHFAGKGCAGIA